MTSKAVSDAVAGEVVVCRCRFRLCRWVCAGWLVCVLVALRPGGQLAAQEAADEKPDQLCFLLFEDYVVRGGKIPGDQALAASDLIVARGRSNGFWRRVVDELRRGRQESEAKCVRILGLMLEEDFGDQEVLRREKETGQQGQKDRFVALSPEVPKLLLERAAKADRWSAAEYAVALLRGHVVEAEDWFRAVLSGNQHDSSAQFYAAVGLAHLGKPEGVRWLIDKSESTAEPFRYAAPCVFPRITGESHRLGAFCVGALQALSEAEPGNLGSVEGWPKPLKLTTKAEWQTWWAKNETAWRPWVFGIRIREGY